MVHATKRSPGGQGPRHPARRALASTPAEHRDARQHDARGTEGGDDHEHRRSRPSAAQGPVRQVIGAADHRVLPARRTR
ncbi:MAG: hypothetical protein ACK55I_37860, partial [bacterium]